MSSESLTTPQIVSWARGDDVRQALEAAGNIAPSDIEQSAGAVSQSRVESVCSALIQTLAERRQEFVLESNILQNKINTIDALALKLNPNQSRQTTVEPLYPQSLVFRYGEDDKVDSGLTDFGRKLNKSRSLGNPHVSRITTTLTWATREATPNLSAEERRRLHCDDSFVSFFPNGVTLHKPNADFAASDALYVLRNVGPATMKALSSLVKYTAEVSGQQRY